MTSTPFLLLGIIILFLAWFTTDVHSEKVLYGLKGSSVVLSPGDAETSIISITWKHGADLAAEWFGGDQTFYRMFNDGCSLNTKTGELTISDVRPEHVGVYTPEINGKILSALKLQVLSPVPKPRITHDCNPEQTKCTLTCSFDRTDDLGDVEVFWILDDRREKVTEIYITKDTKEETFICSLNNPVSSQNSRELKNPLLPRGSRHHYVLIVTVIGLIVLIGVGLFLIFRNKIHQRILRFIRGRNEQRSSAAEEQKGLNDESNTVVWKQTEMNGVTENTREERQNHGSPTIITPPDSPAGGDAVHPEERMLLLNNQECNQTSNFTVTVEINPQTESSTSNRQGPAETPDPVSASETKPELGIMEAEPNTTNVEEKTENQNSAPSLDSKPDPESNTSNTQEPAESPAPSSDSNPDPDPPAGGDAFQPKEITSLLETEECNQTSNVTVPVEINPQTESNVPGSAENPSPAPSSETKPDPESNTSNRQGPAETPDLVSASETKPELGIMQTTVSEPNTTNVEEKTENQNSAPSLDTKPDPESNTSNTQEPTESPAPSSDSNPDPDPETNEEAEDLNTDPPEEDNHETDSGSAENDLPEAERPEDSSGSPGGTVSTSEMC